MINLAEMVHLLSLMPHRITPLSETHSGPLVATWSMSVFESLVVRVRVSVNCLKLYAL